MFTQQGISFHRTKRMDYNTAATENSHIGTAINVVVGTKEINHKRFYQNVSDELFVKTILNMYHESEHCYQKNVAFRQEQLDSYTERQLIQEIACHASNDYYENNGNYLLNASEIQAEQYGIMSVYKYLCDEFPNVDTKEHERIVLGVVNSKMMDPEANYFVKQSTPFTSLQEVEDAFDDAYDKSFTQKRWFAMEDEPKDPVKVFMNDHEEAMEMYYKYSTPVERDRCIAAIALELHPEWLEQYPALQHMDLSYENVIAKPYKELKEREERALHADEERINKVLKGKDEPVRVPEKKKHYNEKDLKGLSRVEQLEMKYGHLLKDSECKQEQEHRCGE